MYSTYMMDDGRYLIGHDGLLFARYDSTGSAKWVEDPEEAYHMDLKEAEAILGDLETAEDETTNTQTQEERVLKALEISSNKRYRKAHTKVLDSEELTDSVTVTIKSEEMKLLLTMVSSKIDSERETGNEITRDESIPVNDMAYELAESGIREERLVRLFNKLYAVIRP